MPELDLWRGLAVLLLLCDHLLVPCEYLFRFSWLYWVRMLTRPSLPLFMVVSGSVLELRWRPGVLSHQAWRVAPFALVATLFASLVPGFGLPEPLTCYLVGLGAVWLFRGREWLGLGVCFLYALAGPWPFAGYDPAEQAGWLLLGVLLVRYRVAWWRAVPLPAWLAVLGRRSLWWYTGQLGVVASVCVLGAWLRWW